MNKKNVANEKEKMFCVYYLESFNAAKAAEKAGFPPEKSANIGARLLSNPVIISEIVKIRGSKAFVLDSCEVEIVERYLELAFSDLNDEKSISQLSVDGDKVNVKMEDRLKALEWLSAFYKLKRSEVRTRAVKADDKTAKDADELRIEICRMGEGDDANGKD